MKDLGEASFVLGIQILRDCSQGLEIIEYFDSDFAGCQDTKCSTSGYIYMMVGEAISWKSVKQTIIALSTITVEFVACLKASNHGI
ncbi:hypothetical protein CR513_27319, partial [Mucuna pruriens]